MAAHHIHYGPNVRIRSTGTGLDDCLIVQWYADIAGDWIEAKRFYQSDDFAHTKARTFASDLAAHLRLVEDARHKAKAVTSPSQGRHKQA